MTRFGYVKVVTGQAQGRIGRFIGWDEKGIKAKVAFGYDTDILPYTNYHFYSINSITNNISKQDLVDRYFELYQDLRAIDLRAHLKVKKYTAEHTSIITECNLVRHLLQVFFNHKNLTLKNKEKNIVLISSVLNDVVWLNEFALELELRGYHVGIIDPEVFNEQLDDDLQYAMDFSDHYIFMKDYGNYELTYIKENLNSIYQSISVITANKAEENINAGYLYLGEPFTEQFEDSLNRLVQRLENPEIYTQI